MVQVKTNKPMCVSLEKEPNKSETIHKVHVHISLFQFQAGQVALNQPLVPFSLGTLFFSKC